MGYLAAMSLRVAPRGREDGFERRRRRGDATRMRLQPGRDSGESGESGETCAFETERERGLPPE